MSSRRRQEKGGLTKEQWRKKHKANCAKGSHEWRPVNSNYAVKAGCEYCGITKLTRELKKWEQKWVRERARYNRITRKKVRSASPTKKI